MRRHITSTMAGLRLDLSTVRSVEEVGPCVRAAADRLSRWLPPDAVESMIQGELEQWGRKAKTPPPAVSLSDGLVRADRGKLKKALSDLTRDAPDLRRLPDMVDLPPETVRAIVREEPVGLEALEAVASALGVQVDKIKKVGG